jgi:hypothetical protein
MNMIMKIAVKSGTTHGHMEAEGGRPSGLLPVCFRYPSGGVSRGVGIHAQTQFQLKSFNSN